MHNFKVLIQCLNIFNRYSSSLAVLKQPLLLRPGTAQIIYPSGSDGKVELFDNEQIELYCSTRFASPYIVGNSITPTCTTNNEFRLNGMRYNFKAFECTDYVAHQVRRTKTRCFNNGYIFEHGFPVQNDRFVKLFDTCQDVVTEENFYAIHKISPANMGYQKSD